MGFHFAPDPSSQQVCTIGGNVANNSGGPHCLAYGVTDAHVLAIEVVLPTGRSSCSAASTPTRRVSTCAGVSSAARARWASPPKVAVRLTQEPAGVRTLLLSFDDVSATRPTPCRRDRSPRASCLPRSR